jgi:phosphomannomutase
MKGKLLDQAKEYFIFGTEGMCGGPIFPYFNYVKDGIFIASKLIEVLTDTNEKISVLYSKLPKYYAYKEKINITNNQIEILMKKLNEELTNEGEILSQVGMNLRFGQGKDWFVLIYPTLKSIRILSEAKSDSLARLYCETTVELIKMLLSKS